MFLFLINYSFLSLFLLAGAPDVNVEPKLINPDSSYLSLSYVNFIRENPGGIKKAPTEERKAHISIAKELTDVGYQFYKLGQDKKAVEKYEEALSHYATDRLYYHYGNSLSNIERLENAIKAYKISLFLGNSNKGRVYYNIACAYSRLKDKERSLENLENAIINGYDNFNYIKIDKDLAFLRSQKEWKEWLGEREKLFRVKIPRDGLVAEYLFEGNVKDASGNKNHGTLFGATLTEDRFGNKNTAYRFDGKYDRIFLDDPHDSTNPTFDDAIYTRTVSIWYKASDLNNKQVIYEEGGHANGLNIYITNSLIWAGAWARDCGWAKGVWLNAAITIDEWHHIVCVFDYKEKQEFKLFHDSELKDSDSVPDYISEHLCADAIGCMIINTRFHTGSIYKKMDFNFKGIIDDVRVYNRALSNKEIQALYNEKR